MHAQFTTGRGYVNIKRAGLKVNHVAAAHHQRSTRRIATNVQRTQDQILAGLEREALNEVQKASVSSMDVDDLMLFDTAHCPHGNVIGVMRSTSLGVLTCSPDETLDSIIPKLNKVTGLPVISSSDNKVIGVISRTDIIKIRKMLRPGSMQDTVATHMTSPAICVDQNSTVQAAADLMLSKKIRRLPVVDELGQAVGIVARSDIFTPLFADAYDLYMSKEVAALGFEEKVKVVKQKKTKAPVTWKIKYLYDGDCPMCSSLMNVLKRQDNGRNLIKFVNIAEPDYKPKSHMGISYEEAMETIHAIQPDGTVLQGTTALEQLFETVGLGWATRIMELPIINKIVDLLYQFLSANRLSLGGALDGIIAAKRMDMSKSGIQTCGDVDEQCTAEW